MKKYQKPWMEIDLFSADVITASIPQETEDPGCDFNFPLCPDELPPIGF